MTAQWSQPTLETLEVEDFSPEPPHYDYAGGSVGGQSVYKCGECGALLQDSEMAVHTFHHAKINVVLAKQV